MAMSRHANAMASPNTDYAICGCRKALFMAWDTHPMCPFHLIDKHYDRSRHDYDADVTPRCSMCAELSRDRLQDWLDAYEMVHHIRPAAAASGPCRAGPSSRSPHRNQPPADVPASVARLHMAVNSKGAPPQASYFGEAGLPATHVRWGDDDYVAPSGVVSAASTDQGVVAEQFDDANVDSIDMDIGSDFDQSEGEDGDGPEQVSRAPPSSRQVHFQRIFDRAVQALQLAPSPVDDEGNQLPSWGLPVDQQRGPRVLPSAPIVEPWYKSTEAKAVPTSDRKKISTPKIQVLVDGLTPSRWALPRMEPALLKAADRPKNKHSYATPSSHPHGEIDKYAREAWFATLRATGLISCIGTLVKYANALTSSSEFETHQAACATAGVDPEWLAEFCTDPSASAYFQELGDCTEALAALVMSAALELGAANSNTTIVRRVAWMDHIGIPKTLQTAYQFHTTKGNGPLVGCTEEVIQKMRQDALDKEVLAKALNLPSPPPPAAGRGRGRGNAAVGANVQGFQDGYARVGLGRGRGRGRGNGGRRRTSNRYSNYKAKGKTTAAAAPPAAEPPVKK